MSRFPLLTRYVAAAALAASTLTVLSTSPASAATGSLAAATNGVTVTVTAGNSASDFAFLGLFNAPHTCTTSSNPSQANLSVSFSSSSGAQIGLIPLNTPTLITFGSVGVVGMGGQGTVGAGSYQACLISDLSGGVGQNTVLDSLAVTIVDPNAPTTTTTAAPTTTTTAAPSTTTTAAVEEPVVPTYTG